MVDFFTNEPLISALCAIIFAQIVKIPIQFFVTKHFDLNLVFSTGGMPSSHSAAVAALTTSIGLTEGLHSPLFAISFIFSIIIMFDATGVRRQAGEHAILLNLIVKDIQTFFGEAKNWHHKKTYEKRKELKELLGHKPIEVFFGALTGVAIALLMTTF